MNHALGLKAKLARMATPRSDWPLHRKIAWLLAYAAVCSWSFFLILPHR